VARVFRYLYNGMLQENMKNKDKRFHPTQKPVALYEWILNKYSKPGEIILDTHVGSASSLIACRNTNHKFVGFEIDKEYYKKAKERLNAEINQMNIFDYGINLYQE
jgi:site-specific DNA-methyltransferase (adenine-specific)